MKQWLQKANVIFWKYKDVNFGVELKMNQSCKTNSNSSFHNTKHVWLNCVGVDYIMSFVNGFSITKQCNSCISLLVYFYFLFSYLWVWCGWGNLYIAFGEEYNEDDYKSQMIGLQHNFTAIESF